MTQADHRALGPPHSYVDTDTRMESLSHHSFKAGLGRDLRLVLQRESTPAFERQVLLFESRGEKTGKRFLGGAVFSLFADIVIIINQIIRNSHIF